MVLIRNRYGPRLWRESKVMVEFLTQVTGGLEILHA